MNSWRLIESPPAAGTWNMAVDAALMESAARDDQCILRFYTWETPTVSLGYFQSAADRSQHAASLSCPIVRRATGGGAILHDRELTYSFAAPAHHPLVADTQGLYRLLHSTLIEALIDWRVVAALCTEGSRVTPAEEPFLCFARRAVGDVLLAGGKIAGSAQRRRRGAVLEHGSVLLAQSPAAPELPGIVELGGAQIDPQLLARAWQRRLASQCAVSWDPRPLEAAEIQVARQQVTRVYDDDNWTRRR